MMRIVASILSYALLAGCIAHTKAVTDAVPVPSRWSAPAEPAGERVDRTWWRSFGSRELDDLVVGALANNANLSAAAARILRADAQATFAGAALLPSLSADSRGATSGAAGASGLQTFTLFALGSYEVDLWGRLRSHYQAGKLNAVAARHDRDTVEVTIAAETVRGYLRIVGLRERIGIARSNLTMARRILATVEARVRSGASGELDLAQQRAAIAGQEASLPALERLEFDARAGTALLLDRPMDAIAVTRNMLAPIHAPRIAAGMPADLLLRRPDLQRAEAQLAAASASIDAARAAFLPRIALTGSTGLQSVALATLFGGGSFAYTLAGNAAQPIFDGGRLSAELDIASANRDELLAGYRAVVGAAFADVNMALIAASTSARQLRSLTEQVRQARIALDLATKRYEAGATDLVAVLEAQRVLFVALDQLSQTRLLALESRVALYRALGGGWELPPSAGVAVN